jgi:hypothetical protein
MTAGSHQRTIGASQVYITPRRILDPLGPFDLDPCGNDPHPWDCAKATFTEADNGLAKNWFGRVWLNPPFDTRTIAGWIERIRRHNTGVALVHARTETEWFRLIWNGASALLFLFGCVIFHQPDGSLACVTNPKPKHFGKPANSGAPVVLCAYGADDRDILASCGLSGKFVPLILPRSILATFVGTWREAIAAVFPQGDFALDDLYRAFASHPKSATNDNVKEKLRQTLARGGFEKVGRGRYRVAA